MSGTCPCCKQAVAAPSLEAAIATARLDAFEASILQAVWSGKGHTVSSERVFDEMYADDPDGGPSPSCMYAALRGTLSQLNLKLKGVGIVVVPGRQGKGYRLSLEENNYGQGS